MKRRTAAFMLAMVLLPAGAGGKSLVKVMDGLYEKHLPAYQKLRGEDFRTFCKSNGLDEDNPDNRERYFRIGFFHEMFTGQGASDCTGAGMLKIPYFWHWIKPNPRHAIRKLPEETPLTQVTPPRRFSRYKSFADIDRVPSLFLSNLVSESPAYRHPDCGDFYTFGWCSEREMAFVLLMSLSGYPGKITQAGNHVTSFFWVSFKKKDKSSVALIAEVDNTFGSLEWSKAPDVKPDDWLRDLQGAGYANRMSRSAAEKRRVRRIQVGKRAAARMDRAIEKYLHLN
jgi:hypothetical protein